MLKTLIYENSASKKSVEITYSEYTAYLRLLNQNYQVIFYKLTGLKKIIWASNQNKVTNKGKKIRKIIIRPSLAMFYGRRKCGSIFKMLKEKAKDVISNKSDFHV